MSGLETHTRMTVDKVLTRPVIRYGSEVWTVGKQEELCLKSAEMKVLRKYDGCSLLDHKRRELITELKTASVTKYLHQHKMNWLHI